MANVYFGEKKCFSYPAGIQTILRKLSFVCLFVFWFIVFIFCCLTASSRTCRQSRRTHDVSAFPSSVFFCCLTANSRTCRQSRHTHDVSVFPSSVFFCCLTANSRTCRQSRHTHDVSAFPSSVFFLLSDRQQ